MSVEKQIDVYIADRPEPKRSDMKELHRLTLGTKSKCKLWFLDGKNDEGKVVSNPNIGYGSYADGTTREFYQIGLTATATGISVYIIGIENKKYLSETYEKDLGKASGTGYCIRFKSLKDINVETLKAAIQFGFETSHTRRLNGIQPA